MFLKVTRESDGISLAGRVGIADSFWTRFRGLMLRETLPPGEGLMIEGCTSIHMMFMRFPIDALFLDSSNTAVGLYQSLRPWTGISGWHRNASRVLELPAETLHRFSVAVGDRFHLEEVHEDSAQKGC
ncbi:MAG: DUF192 domain-containing protein [Candidatus Riflebacteria bacterium]|nr:DUF192 domain-containing protein [Candidatus Riflebacteria bacterium]